MTFLVNHNGQVFEKDLGRNTERCRREASVVRSRPRLGRDADVTVAPAAPPSLFKENR